jgi:alpha-tubulin suppressor-like RCC1 family protein
MNQVPVFPAPVRPAGQLFVWGCGDFGQFGLGPMMLREFAKQKVHPWAKQKMHEGVFGAGPGPGPGIIAVAAGGMHSLFIDENGKVRVLYMLSTGSGATRVNASCSDGSKNSAPILAHLLCQHERRVLILSFQVPSLLPFMSSGLVFIILGPTRHLC